MNDFVYWLLNMSIAGSFGCILILLVRRMKRIPRKYVRILWMIPIIRYLVPISITGRYSIMNLLNGYAIKTVAVHHDLSVVTSNYIQQAESYFPIVYKTDLLAHLFTTVFYIWAVVAGALLISFTIMYRLTGNEIKKSTHIKDNIYCSDSVITAAVYGIYRPKIILPQNIAKNCSRYIIMHEQVHISKSDNLYRCIAIVTACIHWFNPVAWIMLKNCLEDMELACDETVMQNMDREEQKAYAMTILKEASQPRFIVTAFGGAKVKVRLKNIISFKKITLFSGICFTVLCLLIFIILLTNAEV